jgi:hypothetical protein
MNSAWQEDRLPPMLPAHPSSVAGSSAPSGSSGVAKLYGNIFHGTRPCCAAATAHPQARLTGKAGRFRRRYQGLGGASWAWGSARCLRPSLSRGGSQVATPTSQGQPQGFRSSSGFEGTPSVPFTKDRIILATLVSHDTLSLSGRRGVAGFPGCCRCLLLL